MKELKIFLLIFLLGSFVGLVGMVKRMESNDIGRYMHLRDGLYKFGEYYWLRRAGFYYGFSRRCFSLHLERCKGKPIYVAEYKILKGQFVFSDFVFPEEVEERKFDCFGGALYFTYMRENLYYLLIRESEKWEYAGNKKNYWRKENILYLLYMLKLLRAYAYKKLGLNSKVYKLKKRIFKNEREVKEICFVFRNTRKYILNSVKGKKKKGIFSVARLFRKDILFFLDWSIDFLKCDKFRCGDGEGGKK